MKNGTFAFIFVFLLLSQTSWAGLDSLLRINNNKLSDSTASTHYRELGMAYYFERGNLDSALYFLTSAVQTAERSKSGKLIVKAKNSVGLIYREKGIYDQSLSNYLQGLSNAESLKDTGLICSSLMGIAVVHHIQKNHKKAREFYDKAFVLNTATGNKAGLHSYYNNVGLLYFHQAKYDSALIFYTESLKMAEELNDLRGIATCNENIGLIFLYDLDDYNRAIENFKQSLIIWRRQGDNNSVAITLNYMAHALMQAGHYNQAVDSVKQSISLSEKIGSLSAQRDGWELLHRVYLKKNDFQSSLTSFKNYVRLKDSLINSEKIEEITALQVRYEENKKRVKDSLQMETTNKFEIEKRELLLNQESIQKKWMIVGLILLFLLAGVIFYGYKNKQKANVLIEEQKKHVEERNREITDSIVYAKHIQDSILPDQHSLADYGLNGFVFYRPKDIVAGDFYWFDSFAKASESEGFFSGASVSETPEKDNANVALSVESNGAELVESDVAEPVEAKVTEPVEARGLVLFAVGDCTGHGVPGALVSVMCNQAIKQAVRDHSTKDPAFILDKVNDLVNDTFYRGKSGVYDGMDIGFCKFNSSQKKLYFAGANNTLVIIRNQEVIELKGDKQPIGKHPARRNFSLHQIDVLPNDMLYLFSDGFSDQFGGEKQKKLKYVRFKKILERASLFSIDKQRAFLESEFENWRGNLEQVDDVCVMGIAIS